MSFVEEKGKMSVDVVSLHRCLSSHTRASRRSLSLKKYEGRDDRGWTPLHVAAKRGDIEEVRLPCLYPRGNAIVFELFVWVNL